MSTTILLAHLVGLRDRVTRRLREEERGGGEFEDVVLMLGLFLCSGVAIAVITAAVSSRSA